MLVDLALDLDDIATAKDAVSLGLKALRVNEPLYRARMRIEAHCGNRAGVRQAYDELVLLLAELDDATPPTSRLTTRRASSKNSFTAAAEPPDVRGQPHREPWMALR